MLLVTSPPLATVSLVLPELSSAAVCTVACHPPRHPAARRWSPPQPGGVPAHGPGKGAAGSLRPACRWQREESKQTFIPCRSFSQQFSVSIEPSATRNHRSIMRWHLMSHSLKSFINSFRDPWLGALHAAGRSWLLPARGSTIANQSARPARRQHPTMPGAHVDRRSRVRFRGHAPRPVRQKRKIFSRTSRG